MPKKRHSSPPRTDNSPPAKRPRTVAPLPDNPLSFRREPRDTVQISTWNVAGLESCNAAKWGYGFRMYVEADDPHILAITEVNETKDPEGTFESHPDFDFLRARYPYRYWAGRTAVLSKFRPQGPAVYGFPDGKYYSKKDAAARAITVEFKEFYLLATYVPNSGANFTNLDRRKDWAADFEAYIRALDDKKPVVWCGDFNVVRTTSPTSGVSHDLQRDVNFGRVSGTHRDELAAHERLLGPQPWFVDVWRRIYGDKKRQYTHDSKKFGGFRIDGFICSERFLHHVRKCEIRYAVKDKYSVGVGALSDHWPVMLSLELEEP
ncbi:hypothetical protein JCM10213v2_007237 [Rhodosporidiobolus nylandii]